MQIVVVLLLSLLLMIVPARAQFYQCPPYCLQFQPPQQSPQQSQPDRMRPRVHRKQHAPEQREHRRVHRDPTAHRQTDWRDMSESEARDWLVEQTHAFCRKFPKNEACKKPDEPAQKSQ